jgi:uncharacterized SAM-binding protein YcdF (DUF218 family)
MTRSPENPANVEIEQKYQYDAIVVLGAQMVWNKFSKKWMLPAIKEDYVGKIVGGNAKSLAAKLAFEQNLAPLILTTGGNEVHQEEESEEIINGSRSEVLCSFIVRRGVPNESVISIGKIGNTQGNVKDIADYLQGHRDILKKKKIGVVSWKIHLERFRLFAEENDFFSSNGIEIVDLPVEDFLMPRYERWLSILQSTEQWKTYQNLEQKGMNDRLQGCYSPIYK